MLRNVSLILVSFFILSGCKNNAAYSEIVLVTPKEAAKLLREHNDIQWVDVRTKKEVKGGKIPGAVNLVYDEHFARRLIHLDPKKPVLLYCQSGGRSAKSAKILQAAGFDIIYDLEGGIRNWQKAGNPIE